MPVTAPDPLQSRRFSRRLALFYGAFFVCVGSHMPFFPVWLTASGLTPEQIGTALALPFVMRLLVVPFVTGMADRRRKLRASIRLLAVLTAAVMAVTGLVSGPLAIMVLFGLTALVWTPILPLTDGYALRGVMRLGVDYGPIRLWGSAAFVVGALGAGAVSSYLAASHLIWVMTAAALLGAVVSFGLVPIGNAGADPPVTMSARALASKPLLWVVVVIAALAQASHAGYYTFSSMSWRTAGMSGATISALWSTGVLAEVLLFAASSRVELSARTWLAIGATGAALRWFIMMQQPSLPPLFATQLLHGLSFGASHLGTMGLLARLVPLGLTATAQGWLVAVGGIVMAAASMAAGLLYQPGGETVYALMLALALSAVAGAGLAWRGFGRVLSADSV